MKNGRLGQFHRIVGGREVEYAGKYPWMAVLLTTKDNRFTQYYHATPGASFCGGTLVASKYVISAAHCMFLSCARGQVCSFQGMKLQPEEFQVIEVDCIVLDGITEGWTG